MKQTILLLALFLLLTSAITTASVVTYRPENISAQSDYNSIIIQGEPGAQVSFWNEQKTECFDQLIMADSVQTIDGGKVIDKLRHTSEGGIYARYEYNEYVDWWYYTHADWFWLKSPD